MGLLFLFSCEQKQKKPVDGKQLTAQYCQGCHVLPDINQLDKATWKNYVLPRMGYFMGIYPHDSIRDGLIESGEGGERVRQAGIFPEKAVIDTAEWAALCAYILRLAPERLSLPENVDAEDTTNIFEAMIPPLQLSPPSITMAKFSKFGGLYLGDANT